MASIRDDQIRQVKEATDLVSLMGEYTSVQKAGVNFKACCPFHSERTPSLYIYTNDNQYHCFGCGAHGDAITLLREKENLDFVEAVEQLARRAGIELVYEQQRGPSRPRGQREQMNQIMEESVAFYEKYLWQRPDAEAARQYLRQRGLGEAVCKQFRLGWAPGARCLVASSAAKRCLDGVFARTRFGA